MILYNGSLWEEFDALGFSALEGYEKEFDPFEFKHIERLSQTLVMPFIHHPSHLCTQVILRSFIATSQISRSLSHCEPGPAFINICSKI